MVSPELELSPELESQPGPGQGHIDTTVQPLSIPSRYATVARRATGPVTLQVSSLASTTLPKPESPEVNSI
jgi:hypothetical protein